MVSHCSSLETYSSLLNEVVCSVNMIVASIYTVIRSYLLEAMSENDANNILLYVVSKSMLFLQQWLIIPRKKYV